jgi:hydrophobe/amphiphile efflux-1 (HAE1) family protein
MISAFFIERPVFAWVVAFIIMGLGALSIKNLPIEQYPDITAPQVVISAFYPGASAETLENTVTQVIEKNLTGLDGLRYIEGSSSSSGQASITLTFEPGTNPDIAQVQAQNRVAQAESSLPSAVQQQGVSVRKSGSSYALIIGVYSIDGKLSRNDISDFLSSNIADPISRITGVGDINVFGPENAMRIWLNPNLMNKYAVTAPDVVSAIRTQNVQIAAGELGGLPSVENQQLNATIVAQSLMSTPEEFQSILLKTNSDGSNVTLGDVARVEIGAESYGVVGRFNRKPAAGIAIQLAPDANALATIQAVKDRVDSFLPIFPEGLEIAYPIDVSPFIRASIYEVVKTIVAAIMLVVLVIYVFLQNARATFVPAIAIPVVLLGTFAAMYAVGYSINVLTLFALVLAIGMLVDDAIVVVENVERKLELDPSLTPDEASKKSMAEIGGALIGTTVVLWAVFLPMTFFPGSAGVIYKQFAVTIAVAMAFSLLIALTLSPSLCGMILKGGAQRAQKGFFGIFNRGYQKLENGHSWLLEKLLSGRIILTLLFGLLIVASVALFIRIPSSFLPQEDQGRMFVLIIGPPSSTQQQTIEKNKQVEDFFLDQVGGAVRGIFTAAGFSFAGSGQNAGIAFVDLKDWGDRGAANSVFAIQGRAFGQLSQIKDAMVIPIVPPPVSALGNSAGFQFQLVDRQGRGPEIMQAAMGQMLGMANGEPSLTSVRYNGLAPSPQYRLDINAVKATALGIPLAQINETLTTALGGRYVNDFIEKGRIKRVYVQADAPYRMAPSDINDWYVRNNGGTMVPLGTLGTGNWEYGAPKLTRFNGSSSREIQGEATQGTSSGEAMAKIMELVQRLPTGFDVEWTGISYEEIQSGNQATVLYIVAIISVFLVLAALYESWAIPMIILLTVPLGIFGAVLATWFTGQGNDVYFQVGLLMTIGLAAKNAILIVEFAKSNFESGMSAWQSSVTAAQQRLRPILMTSLTFILGVMPLAFADGPGSGAQNAISIGVLGGITATTIFVVFFAPFFFIWVYRMFKAEEVRQKRAEREANDHV